MIAILRNIYFALLNENYNDSYKICIFKNEGWEPEIKYLHKIQIKIVLLLSSQCGKSYCYKDETALQSGIH